jgi:hypothetical protein
MYGLAVDNDAVACDGGVIRHLFEGYRDALPSLKPVPSLESLSRA